MYTFVLVHRKDGSLDFIIRVAQRNIRRYRSRKEGGGEASLCSRGKSEHHWARTLGRIWAPDGGNTRAQRCCTKIHIQRGRRAAYKGEPRPSKYICAYIFSFAVIQSEKSRTNEREKKKKKRKTTKKKRRRGKKTRTPSPPPPSSSLQRPFKGRRVKKRSSERERERERERDSK